MRLETRIAQVEQRLGVAGPCPLCRGRGPSGVVAIVDGVPDRPDVCPACGAPGVAITYVAVAARPGGAAAPKPRG